MLAAPIEAASRRLSPQQHLLILGLTTRKVYVGNGIHITSSITTEAAEDLKLKVGDSVSAVVKSSDVIIGK